MCPTHAIRLQKLFINSNFILSIIFINGRLISNLSTIDIFYWTSVLIAKRKKKQEIINKSILHMSIRSVYWNLPLCCWNVGFRSATVVICINQNINEIERRMSTHFVPWILSKKYAFENDIYATYTHHFSFHIGVAVTNNKRH